MVKEKIYFMGLLANVDSSIMNMDFEHGFKIESMSQDDALDLLSILEGLPYMKVFTDLHFRYCCLREEKLFFISNEIICDVEKDKEGLIRKHPKELISFHNKIEYGYLQLVIRLMRLHKEGNICIPVRYFYYRTENDVLRTLMRGGTTLKIQEQLYHLERSEIPDLKKFISNVEIPFKMDYLDLAFKNFGQSYQLQNFELSFLTLMIGMEVLFNPGGSELTYRISRNLAALIGEDRDDSDNIFNRMHKSYKSKSKKKGLYQLRSEIVHKGKSNIVKEEDVLELRGYLRRAIKEVYEIDKEKKELQKMLDASGFDKRPWKK